MHSHRDEHVRLLLDSRQSLPVHNSEVLHIVHEQAECARLDHKVDLVAHHMTKHALHSEVGPVCPLNPMQILVVLNDSEPVAKGLGVQQWIQRISRD